MSVLKPNPSKNTKVPLRVDKTDVRKKGSSRRLKLVLVHTTCIKVVRILQRYNKTIWKLQIVFYLDLLYYNL